jgi:hypothetical protein
VVGEQVTKMVVAVMVVIMTVVMVMVTEDAEAGRTNKTRSCSRVPILSGSRCVSSRNSSQRLLFGLPQSQTTINKVFLHRHATMCCLDLFLLLQSQRQHI